MEREQTASGPPVPVKRSAEDWSALVREFEASGETLKASCGGPVTGPQLTPQVFDVI